MTYTIAPEFMTAADKTIKTALEIEPVFRNWIVEDLVGLPTKQVKYTTRTRMGANPRIRPIDTMFVDVDMSKYGDTYVPLWSMAMGFKVSNYDIASGEGYTQLYKDSVEDIMYQELKVEDSVIGAGFAYTPAGGSLTYVINGMGISASYTQTQTAGAWSSGNPYNDVSAALTQLEAYGITPKKYPMALFLEYVNRGEVRRKDTVGNTFEKGINELGINDFFISNVQTHGNGLLACKSDKFGKLAVSEKFQLQDPYPLGTHNQIIEIWHTFTPYFKDGAGFCTFYGL